MDPGVLGSLGDSLFNESKSDCLCIFHQRTEIRPTHMLNRLPTTAAKIHHTLITELSGRDTET